MTRDKYFGCQLYRESLNHVVPPKNVICFPMRACNYRGHWTVVVKPFVVD